jgi:hypothetical protein
MAEETYEPGEVAVSSRVNASGKKLVVHLWPIDGQIRRVWGCVELAEQQNEPPTGTWHTTGGCTYVQLDGRWKKVCGGVMTLQIDATSGELEEVHGQKVHDAVDPRVAPTGGWYVDRIRAGCVYVNHNGVWKKVCS